MVKNLPARQEARGQSLGQEDPLEEGVATHSSILEWFSERTGLMEWFNERIGYHIWESLKWIEEKRGAVLSVTFLVRNNKV